MTKRAKIAGLAALAAGIVFVPVFCYFLAQRSPRAPGSSFSPDDVRNHFGTTIRSEYMSRASAYLRQLKPYPGMPKARAFKVVRLDYLPKEYPEVEGRLGLEVDQLGFISLEDGGWVAVLEYSVHDDHGYDPETRKVAPVRRIGDVVLAVGEDGVVYECTPPAHPCPGILLTPPNGRAFQNADEFFSSPVVDGPAESHHCRWAPYRETVVGGEEVLIERLLALKRPSDVEAMEDPRVIALLRDVLATDSRLAEHAQYGTLVIVAARKLGREAAPFLLATIDRELPAKKRADGSTVRPARVPGLALTAIAALCQIANDEEVALLVGILNGADEKSCSRIAATAGRYGEKCVEPLLLAALKRSPKERHSTLSPAWNALKERGSADIVPELAKMALADPRREDVFELLNELWKRVVDKKPMPGLPFTSTTGTVDPDVLRRHVTPAAIAAIRVKNHMAIIASGTMKLDGAVDAIDETIELRDTHYAKWLARIGSARAIDVIVRQTHSHTRRSRLEALKVLKEAGSRRAIPRLYMLLTDTLQADKGGRFCDYAAGALSSIVPNGPAFSAGDAVPARDKAVAEWIRYLQGAFDRNENPDEGVSWAKQLIWLSERLPSDWSQPSALGAALLAGRILRGCQGRAGIGELLAKVERSISHLQNEEVKHLRKRLLSFRTFRHLQELGDLDRQDAITYNLHFLTEDRRLAGNPHLSLDSSRVADGGAYLDAWGRAFRFVYPARNPLEHFEVYSCGPDGKDDSGRNDDVAGLEGSVKPAVGLLIPLPPDTDLGRATVLFSVYDYARKDHSLYKVNLRERNRVGLGPGAHGVWSSDGGRIAFGLGPRRKKALYVMDADGGNRREVCSDFPVGYDGMAWSPDDTRIVFCVDRAGMQLAIVGADGRNGRMLTDDRRWYYWPQWVSERTVMVTASVASRGPNLAVAADVDAGKLANHWLVNASWCRWSPDGRYVAYRDDNEDLLIRPADGGDPLVVTRSQANVGSVLWVGNGRLLFAGRGGVYTVRVDGSGLERLFESEKGWKLTSVHVAAK